MTMAAGYNRIIMIGNLTRDPEYKQLASGQPVCQLGIASNRQYRNKQTGEMVQEVCFVDANVFGPQADSCKQYLQKGRPVLIEGRLKFDTWESPDGQKRSKHAIIADRVVFLSANAETESDERSNKQDLSQDLEKEFFGAQKSAEKKPAKAKKVASETDQEEEAAGATGELSFEDEPPFKDDLPF
jgi:single-strand DNA-binding protein